MPKKPDNNRNIIPRPTKYSGTIDLHGYKKPDAISRLTSFLEEVTRRMKGGDVWVLVITGSGAHSQHGPILRTAVQNLLTKRQMIFALNPGKGSFTVKANSGFRLYAPELPTDTKVVLKEAPERVPRLPDSYTGRGGIFFSAPQSPPNAYSPSPAEVAANDAQFEESRKEHAKVLRERKKEVKLLKKALSMSLLEEQEEKEQEEAILKRVLSLSILEDNKGTAVDDENDDDFLRALEMSQNETIAAAAVEDDEELEKALALSRDFACSAEADHEDLEKVLALSRDFACQEDDEFQRILEQSKLEYEHGIIET